MAMGFRDRTEAGRLLAERLAVYAGRPDVLVLGLPRGGVVVAFEVAQALHALLDVFVVRKLGTPEHEELAMGAIASGGICVLNEDVVEDLRITPEWIDAVVARERRELERRERAYRDDLPLPDVRGRVVILVDDGLATGATMRAAVMALRQMGPRRIVVAAPVGALGACELFERMADEVVCLITPHPFGGVGYWYANFDQTTDDEVRALMSRSRRQRPAPEYPERGEEQS